MSPLAPARLASESEAHRIVHEAVDAGITFFDNAWEYHAGVSEERMGRALAGRRDKVFLMTKVCTHGRGKEVGMAMLEDSLRRLQTDHLDLWQIHECIYDNDPDLHFAADGVIEAVDTAKKAGKVRFVGFTGHKDPAVHGTPGMTRAAVSFGALILTAAARTPLAVASAPAPLVVAAAPAPPATAGADIDATFATLARQANAGEIAMANLALRRSNADEARMFAQNMLADHGPAAERLAAVAPAPAGEARESDVDRLALLRLAETPAPDFNQQYLMQQIGDHLAAISVYSTEAEFGRNPELKALAAHELPTLRAHLQEAVEGTGHIGGSSPFYRH